MRVDRVLGGRACRPTWSDRSMARPARGRPAGPSLASRSAVGQRQASGFRPHCRHPPRYDPGESPARARNRQAVSASSIAAGKGCFGREAVGRPRACVRRRRGRPRSPAGDGSRSSPSSSRRHGRTSGRERRRCPVRSTTRPGTPSKSTASSVMSLATGQTAPTSSIRARRSGPADRSRL